MVHLSKELFFFNEMITRLLEDVYAMVDEVKNHTVLFKFGVKLINDHDVVGVFFIHKYSTGRS